MPLDYILSFIGEFLAGFLIPFLAFALPALAFSPLLRARWNSMLKTIEDIIVEFLDMIVRWVLGME